MIYQSIFAVTPFVPEMFPYFQIAEFKFAFVWAIDLPCGFDIMVVHVLQGCVIFVVEYFAVISTAGLVTFELDGFN